MNLKYSFIDENNNKNESAREEEKSYWAESSTQHPWGNLLIWVLADSLIFDLFCPRVSI